MSVAAVVKKGDNNNRERVWQVRLLLNGKEWMHSKNECSNTEGKYECMKSTIRMAVWNENNYFWNLKKVYVSYKFYNFRQ